ncbi:terminase gpA endonuclease subunit [Sphingomonas sp. 1P06PA]|uniref:phage terminase large subunit family protein n=1 Tax=Sphingomonas sp. 1P06PA TaxID=554121 RepID=UPI0039A61255
MLVSATRHAASTLKPPPKLSLSEWSERYAHLPDTSAKPGRYRLATASYQRGILDAISDPVVLETVVMSSAQVGKTQILLNAAGYFIDQDPSPQLLVLPTVDNAKDFSKERLAAFIRASPRLKAKVPIGTRVKGSTLLHKEYQGGNITLAGANSPTGLASRPKRVVYCDEVGRYPASAGTEGDPVTLAFKRTETFWNRKKVQTSTPGTAGVCRIERAFLAGDQRRYWVRCPDCGHHQTLKWRQVKWSKGDDGEHDPSTARYECEGHDPETGEVCGARWSDAQRWRAVRQAEDEGGGWRAEKPFRGIASFHLSELYSSFRRLAETVADFLAAKGNPEQLKSWTNTALGEAWQEKGDAPEWQRLYDRREPAETIGEPPSWAALLTAAVDVQRNRVELDVWGWGPNRWRAFVETVVIEGRAADADTWRRVDAELAREWRTKDGRRLKLAKVAADTGDGDSTMEIYAWARKHPALVMPIKGRHSLGISEPIAGPKRVDVTISGKTIKGGVKLWSVATSMLKQEFYSSLGLERALDGQQQPDGYVFLPMGTTDEDVKQMVSEQFVRVRTRTGSVRMEWQKLRDRNERLDIAIYARAAAYALGVDRWSAARWDKLIDSGRAEAERPTPSSDAAKPKAAQRRSYLDRSKTSNWLKGRR